MAGTLDVTRGTCEGMGRIFAPIPKRGGERQIRLGRGQDATRFRKPKVALRIRQPLRLIQLRKRDSTIDRGFCRRFWVIVIVIVAVIAIVAVIERRMGVNVIDDGGI